MTPATNLTTALFVLLVFVMAAAVAVVLRQAFPDRSWLAIGIFAAIWLLIPAALAASGRLDRYDPMPAPALALILSEAIEQGHLVGIMADRCAQGERSSTIDFLGAPAEFPAGVWQLAALLKAPVISCFGVYAGAKRYDLHFELISEQLGTNRQDRTEAIEVGMARYVAQLQDLVCKHPYNWFNFYDFWQDESTAHH